MWAVTCCSELRPKENGVWCKSGGVMLSYITLPRKTDTELPDNKSQVKIMSSSYYVNALFSKYTAGASLFQNAEPTSCSFAPNSQRSGYGAAAGAFPSTVPGLYNVNSPLYQNPFASGYGLGADAYGNLPCASYDQNIPGLCSDLAKGACDKADEGALHGSAEANFRIYPWMRSSGRRSR